MKFLRIFEVELFIGQMPNQQFLADHTATQYDRLLA